MSTKLINDEILHNIEKWNIVGRKILNHYNCPETYFGIGQCIELWKKDKAIEPSEVINALGFLFGSLLLNDYGGSWVQVEDSFGNTIALQSQSNKTFYVLDSISKRLKDNSRAEEIQSLADHYQIQIEEE